MDLIMKHHFLVTLLVLGSGTMISANAANIQSLCKNTDYPALCNSFVKSDSRYGGAAHAVKSSIQAIILQTRQTLSKASKAIGTADKAEKEKLSVCQELYGDAISDLQSSLKSLKAKSHYEVRVSLSAVLSDFETCDDTFNEDPVRKSNPLEKDNVLLKHLTSNSLALVTQIKKD